MRSPPDLRDLSTPQLRWDRPQRNVGLVVVGAILLAIGLAAGLFFAKNLYQYLTVGTGSWGAYTPTSILDRTKADAKNAMLVSMPMTLLSSLAGLVVGALGLRRRSAGSPRRRGIEP